MNKCTTVSLNPALWPLALLHPLWRAIEEAGGEIRLVGGCVRDALLGRPVKDLDAATTLLPDVVMTACETAAIRTIPTGIAFGTITALLDELPVQITTLRADIKNDGRWAEVQFGTSWQEDAQRRDFTMNALYADLNGNVYDYFSGYADVQNGVIRAVGDPLQRFKEDYLRILRLYRFYAGYGRTPLGQAERGAAQTLRNGLKNLSRERVNYEMERLLQASHPLPALQAMQADGIWPELFAQDLNVDGIAQWLSEEPLVILNHSVSKVGDPPFDTNAENSTPGETTTKENLIHSTVVGAYRSMDPRVTREDDNHLKLARFAACWRDAEDALEAAKKWGWRKRDIEWLQHFAELQNHLHSGTFHLTTALYQHDTAMVATALQLYAPALYNQYQKDIAVWQPQIFPVTAQQVMDLGIPAGPALGNALRQLEMAWLQSDMRLTANQLLGLSRGGE